MYNVYRIVETIPEGDIAPLYWTGGSAWSSDRADAMKFTSVAEAADLSNSVGCTTWIIESWKAPV